MSTLSEHPTFHGASVLAVEGQFAELTVRFWIPSEMLKVLSYNWEAVLTWLIILVLTAVSFAKSAVYVQSVAIPIRATFLDVGQPWVEPMVEAKLTAAPLPPVVPSICRPNKVLGDTVAQKESFSSGSEARLR